MQSLKILLFLVAMLPAAAVAAEEGGRFTIGGDSYIAGRTSTFEKAETDDLFIAGETVRISAPVQGTAHAAGRDIAVKEEVAGDFYAIGMDIRVLGPVGGDVTATGMSIGIEGAVGADLRVSGRSVKLEGPIAGTALIAAQTVQIAGNIEGDVAIAAENLEFGRDATIGGMLRLYVEDRSDIEVPESVVPEDRVEWHEASEWEEEAGEVVRGVFWSAVLDFVAGIVFVTVLAAVFAALAPETLADLRRRILDSPGRNLWFGALGFSALAGSVILLMMTVLGIIVAPAAVVLTGIAAFLGYVAGIYAIGVWITRQFGRDLPSTFAERAVAAFSGAVSLALVSLIPLLGWLAVLAVALTGLGSVIQKVFSPAFYTE